MLRFAKYLRVFGWQPIVITVNSLGWRVLDYSLYNKLEDYEVLRYASEHSEKYYSNEPNIFSITAKVFIGIRAIARLDPMYQWRDNILAELPKILEKYAPSAALITAPPFSALEILKDIKDIAPELPTIADLRDLLWIFLPFGSVLRKLANRIQRRRAEHIIPIWLKYADGIVMCNEAFGQALERLADSPAVAIPTPYDPDDYPEQVEYRRGDKFIILHSGSLHRHTEPQSLFNIFSILPDDILARTELRLQGYISHSARRIFDRAKWAKILPQVEHRKALLSQMQADANIAFITTPNRFGGGQIMPGKVYDYIGAGRPIIAIGPRDGVLVSTVRRYRLGFSAPVEEPALAAGAIAKAFRLWEQNALEPIHDQQRKVFNANEIVKKLANFLNRIVEMKSLNC